MNKIEQQNSAMLKHHRLRIIEAQENLSYKEVVEQKISVVVLRLGPCLVHDDREMRKEIVADLKGELSEKDERQVATSRCGIINVIRHNR